MGETVRLRVNAMGMSELSTDTDISGLAPREMRARLEAMDAPLVRYGLSGSWGLVQKMGTRHLDVVRIGGAAPTKIEYGDIDLVCERTDLTMKRAEHEGSMDGIAARMVDTGMVEALQELLQAKPPQAESEDFYRGVGHVADRLVRHQALLRMPRWARSLDGIVLVDADVVQHVQ